MFLLPVIFCTHLLITVDSARILGVFPIPSLSHQYVFRALTTELAKRDHELVIITPSPALPKNRPPDNITEIDISYSYELRDKAFGPDKYKRGILVDAETIVSFENYKSMVNLIVSQMDHPDVKKLIDDKNQHFDLILIEAFLNVHLIFTEIFKAPAIMITSFYGFPEIYEMMGAVGRHPVFYPNPYRQFYGGSTLFEKLKEIKMEYYFMNTFKMIEVYESHLLKAKFGPNAPTIVQLKNNIDMLFVNLNPIFRDNRPVPPNVKYVGPLHLQPIKDLPDDLQFYLDQSKTGVIYVSLGTNAHASMMDEDLLNAFLDAFEVLPYDILWKFDGELKRKSRNIKYQKWFPQRDLLAHRNIKLFVTQGGLQSTDEAIDATTPMVVIPTFGDQFYNGYKIEQLGIGVSLDPFSLDATVLVEAIEQVLRNNSYKINIEKIKKIVDDQPQTPLEHAVWWTEYVIRHKGGRHLRCPTTNVSWLEYLMIDILLLLFSFLLLVLLAVFFMLKYSSRAFKTFWQKRKVKLP